MARELGLLQVSRRSQESRWYRSAKPVGLRSPTKLAAVLPLSRVLVSASASAIWSHWTARYFAGSQSNRPIPCRLETTHPQR